MDIFRLYGHFMTQTPEKATPKTPVLVRFEPDEYERLRLVAKAEKLPRTVLIRRVVDDFCNAVIKAKGLVATSAKTEEVQSAEPTGDKPTSDPSDIEKSS